MLATQAVAVTEITSLGTTSTDRLAGETLIKDVTLELLGEQRQEWRDGFDAGVKSGVLRIMQSETLIQLASELALLREVASKLGAKCDYWMHKSDEFEAAADHWYSVAAR